MKTCAGTPLHVDRDYNVSIFDHSDGGYTVRAQMGTPSTKDLFETAIVQSGSRLDPTTDKASAAKVAELTLAKLGLKPEEADKLATVDYYKLLAMSDKAPKDARYAPVADGAYIMESPVGACWVDETKDIPLMAGDTQNEFETVSTRKVSDPIADNENGWDDAKAGAKLKKRFGDKSDAVGKAFLAAYPEKKLADAYFVDLPYRVGAVRDLDVKAKQAGYESPVLDGIAMSWHCSELPYVFDNAGVVKTATGGSEEAVALSKKMSQAWVNFARTGKTSAQGLPE
jgi:para-nitrobenzyl esterase